MRWPSWFRRLSARQKTQVRSLLASHMNFNEYILEELNNLKPQNNHEAKVDIADLIFKFLMSKKFRKYAVSPEYQNYIKQSVNKSISAGEPIKLTWPFGGYKLWRLAEAPEVDWAELFSLIYFTKWLKPVSEIYQPGVWLDFYSDDIVVEMMDIRILAYFQ